MDQLRARGLAVRVGTLPVGDAVWVARSRYDQLPCRRRAGFRWLLSRVSCWPEIMLALTTGRKTYRCVSVHGGFLTSKVGVLCEVVCYGTASLTADVLNDVLCAQIGAAHRVRARLRGGAQARGRSGRQVRLVRHPWMR